MKSLAPAKSFLTDSALRGSKSYCAFMLSTFFRVSSFFKSSGAP
ncbi:hypothetical protein STRPS_2047 [Streptococcus pseudoporcinus LQ 940-04]|uniref:Uncharacterized protein n=1 Tax=Streptococcus pseudoporcinus LQ 940-04 TaxID=875093 RepID=G5KAT3_9STRE|nr:hypothetical protein HMPREF9320_0686 [Streptococcus pseudoporcinus SPIN 20026]EHI65689.1 hypothetical protein STRPS_2047 [Streptococcus pseudoporcinus LQ 940-04]